MEVLKYEYNKALSLAPSVMALGFFDGVTAAHRQILQKAKEEAQRRGISFGVFTFYSEDPIKRGVERIYSTTDKLTLLERCGANFTVLADFESICSLSPESFVEDLLIKDLNVSLTVTGYNFRFGKGAAGNAERLALIMKSNGKEAVTVNELTDRGEPISSTLIRKALAEKDIKRANRLLGAPYFIRGRVSEGNRVGRNLGFPTVNTSVEKGRIIPTGVFRSSVTIDGKVYNSITNIGTCPTLGERSLHAETHILNYKGNLYGRELEIYLLEFLREERQFNSKEELRRQIEEDIKRTLTGEN